MKVILTAKDLLPLIQALLAERYPEHDKVKIQFVMQRTGGLFSSHAEMAVECELDEPANPRID